MKPLSSPPPPALGAARRSLGQRRPLGLALAVLLALGAAGAAPAAARADEPTTAAQEPEAGAGGAASEEAAPMDGGDAGAPTTSVQVPLQTVVGEREQPRFLPAVDDVEIFEGKKTTVIDPEEPPKIVNDNYRQVLSRTPGLLLSEESSPLVSMGYRGLDPHRTQFTQVMKDGIPIAADMFGYPESYYLPPIDAVERIDFVRGGGSLLYGPQPGGALNYVTRSPNPDARFSLTTNQSFGSDDYYSTYNAVSGTVERFGYLAYYYQKQGDGFRRDNSDFGLYSGSLKTTYAISDASSLTFVFDGYNEGHGEPGGLRLTPAANAVLYQADRTATSRFNDRFRLERYMGSLIYENEISEDTLLRVAGWGGYYGRWSARQRGGGFGTLPSGSAASTNSIEDQVFKTGGLDARVRQHWGWLGQTHSLTAGIEYFHDTSPRVDSRGTTPDARTGVIRNKSVRHTNYGSLFAENRFVIGDFAIIPAIRLENFSEAVKEKVNVDRAAAGQPLADESTYDFQPLYGLGAAYTIVPAVEVYGNVSSAYRPEIFSQAVSTSPTQTVSGNLSPGKSWQYEVGFRGQPAPFAFWDTSLFWLDFSNQIGTVQLAGGSSEIRNVGRSRHLGWEASTQIGLVGLWDWWQGTTLTRTVGEFSIFGSVMLLDAEFTRGPFEGNTPAYAPDHLVRAGFEYEWRERFRAQMLATVVASSYGNDNNTAAFFIPAYAVYDLTVEADVYEDVVSLYLTVNNLFDADYWSRVRSDGIDPAYGRNFHGGVKVSF